MQSTYFLKHYGIKLQRWGVRRYQNPDGSLTEEGKLRYRTDAKGRLKKLNKKERLDAKEKLIKEQNAKKPLKEKRIEYMTDSELHQYISRLTIEKQAYLLRKDISSLNPKQVSAGKKFIDSTLNNALNNVVMPTLINLGKSYFEKAIKKASHLDDKTLESPLQKSEKESKYWQNLSNIENNKANYNRVKALNDLYEKSKDPSIYRKERKNN